MTFRTVEERERISFGLVVLAAFLAAFSLLFIVSRLHYRADRWLLQVTVFVGVATVPLFLVEWFARLTTMLGKDLRASDHERWFRNPGALLGMFERLLFLGALVARFPEFIAAWYVYKGIAGWKQGGTDIRAGRQFQLLLLNNAVSLAGVALGWMAWNLLDLPKLGR